MYRCTGNICPEMYHQIRLKKPVIIEINIDFYSTAYQSFMREKHRILTWETVNHDFQVRNAYCCDRWPAAPQPAVLAASSAFTPTFLFEEVAHCLMQIRKDLADVSRLVAIETHWLSPFRLFRTHSCNSCTQRCTGSAGIPALKAASPPWTCWC